MPQQLVNTPTNTKYLIMEVSDNAQNLRYFIIKRSDLVHRSPSSIHSQVYFKVKGRRMFGRIFWHGNDYEYILETKAEAENMAAHRHRKWLLYQYKDDLTHIGHRVIGFASNVPEKKVDSEPRKFTINMDDGPKRGEVLAEFDNKADAMMAMSELNSKLVEEQFPKRTRQSSSSWIIVQYKTEEKFEYRIIRTSELTPAARVLYTSSSKAQMLNALKEFGDTALEKYFPNLFADLPVLSLTDAPEDAHTCQWLIVQYKDDDDNLRQSVVAYDHTSGTSALSPAEVHLTTENGMHVRAQVLSQYKKKAYADYALRTVSERLMKYVSRESHAANLLLVQQITGRNVKYEIIKEDALSDDAKILCRSEDRDRLQDQLCELSEFSVACFYPHLFHTIQVFEPHRLEVFEIDRPPVDLESDNEDENSGDDEEIDVVDL